LKSGSTSSDGDLDRTRRREKKKVDPSSDGVDETGQRKRGKSALSDENDTEEGEQNLRLLKDILLNVLLLAAVSEHLRN